MAHSGHLMSPTHAAIEMRVFMHNNREAAYAAEDAHIQGSGFSNAVSSLR